MKATRKIIALMLAMLMLLSTAGMTLSAFSATVKVTKVALNSATASVYVSGTYQLKATVTPSNATNKAVAWSTSNSKIATVSTAGLVKGVKAGTATITVTAKDGSGKKATCKVTVKAQPKATKVAVNTAKPSVYVGKTYQLKATVTPAAANQAVTWKSSNTKVATVSTAGLVKGVKAGTATITATAKDGSGKKVTATVTVKAIPKATAVKLNASSGTVFATKTVQLKATVTPAAANQAVTWKSSNTKVATVSTAGLVKGVKAGTATITATAKDGSGKKATYKVTVKAFVKVTKLTLNATAANVNVGATYTLKATVAPTNASIKALTWKSSNTAVATVTTAGVVKGIKAGTANITAAATDGSGKSVVCKVTVKNVPATSVKLSSSSLNVGVGKTVTLTATVAPTNTTNKAVTWTSNNTSVATVTSAGVVKGIKTGTATVTVKTKDGSNKTASCTINVVPVAKSISIATYEHSWYEGYTGKLFACVYPAEAGQAVTWSSSDTSSITVDANGNVKVVSVKQTGIIIKTTTPVTITATAKDGSGVKATYVITPVKKTAVKNVTFAIGIPETWYVGQTGYIKAFTDEKSSDRRITYSSSAPAVATVDANTGLVKALKAGTAKITAKSVDGGKTASFTITVKNLSMETYICEAEVYDRYYKGFYENLTGIEVATKTLIGGVAGDTGLGQKYENLTPDILDVYTSSNNISGIMYFKAPGTAKIRAVTNEGGIQGSILEIKVKGLNGTFYYDGVKVNDVITLDITPAGAASGENVDIEYVEPESPALYLDKETGKVTVISELPAEGASITVKGDFVDTYYPGIEKQIWFFPDKYTLPTGTKDQLLNTMKKYSASAKNLKTARFRKSVDFSDTVVDDGRSSMAITLNGVPLTIPVDMDEEFSVSSLVKDIFTDDAGEETLINAAKYPAAITVSSSDVSSVSVKDYGRTYTMTLKLNPMSKIPLKCMEFSSYAKAMPVVDSNFMEDYEKSIKTIMGNETEGISIDKFTVGTMAETCKDGYVTLTIDKSTDRVVSSEYGYTTNIDIENAGFSMDASIGGVTGGGGLFDGDVTIGTLLSATFTTTAKVKSVYTSVTY